MLIRLTSRAVLGCSVGVALFVTASTALAQPAAEPKLPEGLRHVPPDALGFIHIRTADFLRSDVGKQLMIELVQDKDAVRGMKKIEQELGVELAEVESVTLLMLSVPNAGQMRMWDGPRRRPYYKVEPKVMPKPVFEDKKAEEEKQAEPGAKDSPVLFQQPPDVVQPFPDMHPEEVAEYMAFSGPLVIVTSTKALDRKKILKTQLFKNRPHGIYDHRPGMMGEASVLFLTDRSMLLGAPWELARYSEHMARNPGPKTKPMQSALAMGAEPHMVVAGGHVPPSLSRMLFMPFRYVPELQGLASVAPLLHTEAGMTIDMSKSLDVNLQFNAPTEISAANALQAAKTLRALGELALDKSNEQGEPGGWKLVLEKRLRQALAEAVIEQKGLTVKAQLRFELDPVLVKRYTKEIVVSIRSQEDRTQSVNNLKNMALAMHSYHGANKRLPPAGLSSINDPTGKPLLSWRVAILPYIDQFPLYQKFDLTQPWDHPTNKKLIPLMPQVYVLSGAPESKEPGMTHYRVLVGPQTMFEPGQRLTVVGITDGTSNTMMVVEAREPTIWTRPDDLTYDPKGPLPKFGVNPEGFNAAFGDGAVHYISGLTPEETLRAYITRNGGESVPYPGGK